MEILMVANFSRPLATRREHLPAPCLAVLCCALAMLLVPPVRAAIAEGWVHRYSTPVTNAQDNGFNIVHDGAGHVIVAGYSDSNVHTQEMVTIKYSVANGAIVWERRHGPSVLGLPPAIAIDAQGNVVVAGVSATIKYLADGTRAWTQAGGKSVAIDAEGNAVVLSGVTAYSTTKYAAADGTRLWERQHVFYTPRDIGQNYPQALGMDPSGAIVVVGYAGTIKYLADGTSVWTNYNGVAMPAAMAIDRNGNIIITGSSSTGSSTLDYHTVKWAPNGSPIWERRYGTSFAHDYAMAVALDANGDVVVTGNAYASGTGEDYYTVKYASTNGAVLWEARYHNESDYARALAIDSNGNVLVTGRSSSGSAYDYATVKYAAQNGQQLWQRRYTGFPSYDDHALAVVTDAGGNAIVTGFSFNARGDSDGYTVAYGAGDGAIVWEQRFSGMANNDDGADAVAIDAHRNVIVAGSAWNGTDWDYSIAKFATTNGALLWVRRYDGGTNGSERAADVAVDQAGNVVTTGFSWNGRNYDYYTAKYSANGDSIWAVRYNGAADKDDSAVALALDSRGNVVVTGRSSNGTNDDFYTAKYAALNGALLWEQRYGGASNDVPKAIATDSAGNALVTGDSWNTHNPDYYTVKHAAADGTPIWTQRFNGPSNGYDFVRAVAVDKDGNVAVTGMVANGDTFDYYTVKYAAADGAAMWEKYYNAPANGNDQGEAVAIDSMGNVIVTGASYNGASYYNFTHYTAKYAAADGALLWETRGSAWVGSHQLPTAIAVDADDNIVLAGNHTTGSTESDYFTMKFASADGTALWASRYDGPANGYDFLTRRGLGIGPRMVVVAGTSDGDFGPEDYSDQAIVVYREPPALSCVAIVTNATEAIGATVHFDVTGTDDSGIAPTIVCNPPSGSLFPVGTTYVDCTATDDEMVSSTCISTVTVLVSRGAIEQIVTDLRTWREDETDPRAMRRLDGAIRDLTLALAPELWIDQTHVHPQRGTRIFDRSHLVILELCRLTKRSSGGVPGEEINGLINRILEANRLLAVVAHQDALNAAIPPRALEQAQNLLRRGDQRMADARCANGMASYRRAWMILRQAP